MFAIENAAFTGPTALDKSETEPSELDAVTLASK